MDEAPEAAIRDTVGVEVRQRLLRWAEESQQVLQTIPRILAEQDQLTNWAQAAEQESERLRQEMTQVGETLQRVLNDTVQSLSGTLERLRAPQARGQ